MKRNPAGGRAIPANTVGAYERENAATFGAGTLRKWCAHQWWTKHPIFWTRGALRTRPFAWERPEDAVGDKRCNQCGAKDIAL